MSVDTRSWLRQCDICARRKSPLQKRQARLQQLSVGAPLERIAVDSFCSTGDKKLTQGGYPVELKIFLFVFWKLAIEALTGGCDPILRATPS